MATGNAFDMRRAILAFAAGILLLQLQTTLPGLVALATAAALAAVLGLVGRRWRSAWLPAAALLGFAWAGGLAALRMADALPAANEGRDIEITGVIAGLPQAFENGLRFEFAVETAAAVVPSRLSLACIEAGGARTTTTSMPCRSWRLANAGT
jgi:competence protein ComEC